MKKQQVDFNNQEYREQWYDLREDWTLIEASLAKQYGIRIRQQTDMPWEEFCILVSGLMPDTPLGAIVEIRAEKDKDRIAAFSSEQRHIYDEWQQKQIAKQLGDTDSLDKEMDGLYKFMADLCGAGER